MLRAILLTVAVVAFPVIAHAQPPPSPPPPPGQPAPAGPPSFFVAFAAGSGAGAVGGTTEQLGAEVNCCIERSPLHVRGELGKILRPGVAIGVSLRVGFPLGADVPGHATTAPSASLRLYKLLPSGVAFHAGVGAGVLRYPVKTYTGDGTAAVYDTVATGPLLIGAGVGYGFEVAAPVWLFIDLDATGAIAVIDELDGKPVESGFNLEAEIGLMLQF
jgi:hypothetical protein